MVTGEIQADSPDLVRSEPTSSSASRRWFRFLLVAVGLVSLGLQLWAPGPTTETVDETHWLEHSDDFAQAIRTGHFGQASSLKPIADLPIPTVPGVTTMWAGIAGRQIARLGGAIGISEPIHGSSVDSPQVLRAGRGVVSLACTVSLLVLMVILDRLFNRRVSILTGITLAVEPRLVGLAGILHSDAMIMYFSVVSVTALALFAQRTRLDLRGHWRALSPGWFLLSAGFAALAFLTKLNALGIVLPGAAFVIWHQLRSRPGGLSRTQRFALERAAALWVGLAVAVSLLLFPGLWAAPITQLRSFEAVTTMSKASRPIFFAGSVHDGLPFGFYPVNLVFLRTPWCLLLCLGGLATGIAERLAPGSVRLREKDRRARIVPAWVLLATAPYALVLATAHFGYARYMIPMVPFGVIAGTLALDHFLHARVDTVSVRRRIFAGICVAILGLGVFSTVRLAPYAIDYVDPLVGGRKVAAQWIPLGWQESMAELGQTVEQREGDHCDQVTIAVIHPMSASLPCGRTTWLASPEHLAGVDYVITQIMYQQRNHHPSVLPWLVENATPIDTNTIDGVDYGTLWKIDRP